MVEVIKSDEQIIGIVLRANFTREGIEFFTPEDFSQQLGYMCRPRGYQIEPHQHTPIARLITVTQEVLFIRKGKLQVDFYNDVRQHVDSRILGDGDVVLLASGGHGFTMLEETEIIEVRQGPYNRYDDKVRFVDGD